MLSTILRIDLKYGPNVEIMVCVGRTCLVVEPGYLWLYAVL